MLGHASKRPIVTRVAVFADFRDQFAACGVPSQRTGEETARRILPDRDRFRTALADQDSRRGKEIDQPLLNR